MPIKCGMSPSWRDIRRNYRENRSDQPRGNKRTQVHRPPRSAVNLPMPVFLRLLRQTPPKSD
jgi:hypothetical protein